MSSRPIVNFLAAAAFLTPAAVLAQERVSLSAKQVAIYNLAGEVRVERGNGPNVVVDIERAGADANRLDVRRAEKDGWQLLVVRYPDAAIVYRRAGMSRFSRSEFRVNDDGTFGLRNLDPALGSDRVNANAGSPRSGRRIRVAGSGRGLEAHADLRIAVPEGKAVAVHLGVGTVVVANVSGDLQVDARSASVESRGTQGFLRIDTGSGRIAVAEASGDVALNTGSGGVDAARLSGGGVRISTGSGGVRLDEVSAPALRVSTGSGGIRATSVNAAKFDLRTGSGSIHLGLAADVDAGRVRTGSGGVTITTPAKLGADVTLNTGSGGIDVDVPVTILERKRSFLRGTLGDGRGVLDVGTGSGSITLR